MLTKNGRTAIAMVITAAGANVSNNGIGLLPVIYHDGVVRYIYPHGNNWPMYKNYANSVSFSKTGEGIIVGSDNTPANESDYDLGAIITTGLTGSVSRIASTDANDKNAMISFDILLTNTSSAEIIVNEIGLNGRISSTTVKGANTGANTSMNFLVDRTVLSEPVIIAPGDYETIRYTISAEV